MQSQRRTDRLHAVPPVPLAVSPGAIPEQGGATHLAEILEKLLILLINSSIRKQSMSYTSTRLRNGDYVVAAHIIDLQTSRMTRLRRWDAAFRDLIPDNMLSGTASRSVYL